MLTTILISLSLLFVAWITGFVSLYLKQCKKCWNEIIRTKNHFTFAKALRQLPEFWKSKLHLNKWNEHSWDVGAIVYNTPFKKLNDNYLKMALFSEPLLMYMKRNDEDFVREFKEEVTKEQLLESIQKLRNDENVQDLERAEMLEKICEEFYGN